MLNNFNYMISIFGKVVGEYKKDPITLKDGTSYQVKVLAINDGRSLVNTQVEVPVDYKLVPDKDGNVRIEGLIPSRVWNNERKQYVANLVSYYMPRNL